MTVFLNDTFAFEALAVAGSAVGFTAATFENAIAAQLVVEDAQVRYRVDGTDPTASVGAIADPGDVINISGYRDITSIRLIRTGGISAIVNAHFVR